MSMELTMRNVLFVTAHPDDLEINAGGTVSKLLEEQKRISSFICSKPKEINSERINEALRAKDILRYNNLYIAEYEDTKIFLSLNELINDLDNYIRKYEIDTIFTHHPGDGHHDHYTVSQAAAAASRKVNTLIYFRPTAPSTNSGLSFKPNLIMNLHYKDVLQKMKALKCHESQVKKYGEEDWLTRMQDIAVADAWLYTGKHGYAEVFEISRLKL